MVEKTEESVEKLMRMIGFKGTRKILEFLNENKEGRYMHFRQFANTHVLNDRLKELLNFGFVEHHLTKSEKKREWYTTTEKGREILYYIKKKEETL